MLEKLSVIFINEKPLISLKRRYKRKQNCKAKDAGRIRGEKAPNK